MVMLCSVDILVHITFPRVCYHTDFIIYDRASVCILKKHSYSRARSTFFFPYAVNVYNYLPSDTVDNEMLILLF